MDRTIEVDKQPCQYLKPDGIRCRNHPLKGASRCFVHSVGRVRGVPWYLNGITLAASVLGLVGFPITLQSWWTAPSGALVESLAADTNEIARNTARLAEEQRLMKEDVQRILRAIDKVDKTQGDQLLAKFQHGYVLFGIRGREIVLPYTSRLTREFEVNLESSSVELKEDTVLVKLPHLTHHDPDLTLNDLWIGGTRRPGFITPGFSALGLTISIVVLEDFGSSVVCALGFSDTVRRQQR